jgi:hypothetical protein
MKAFGPLKFGDHVEDVSRLGGPFRAKHAHEALGRHVRHVAQFLESDRRIDVVTQDRFTGIRIAGEQALNALAQQFPCGTSDHERCAPAPWP